MAMMVQPDPENEESTKVTENPISYRARRNKRLRIYLKSNTGDQTYSRITGLVDPGMQEWPNRDIGRAQAEMFDDEVFEMVGVLADSNASRLTHCFSKIRVEAQNSPTLNTRSSVDQISIDAVPGEELVFEMARHTLELRNDAECSDTICLSRLTRTMPLKNKRLAA